MSEENANVSRDEEQARQMVQDIIASNPLCHKTEEDAQMIRKAFELANEAHRGCGGDRESCTYSTPWPWLK